MRPALPLLLTLGAVLGLSAAQPAPVTLELGQPLPAPASLQALGGFNLGNWMQVAEFRDDLKKVGPGLMRFPGGNVGDENDLNEGVLKALKANMTLLGASGVIVQTRVFATRPDAKNRPQDAADAARIAKNLGINVRYWEIGNEPDLYSKQRGDPSWTPEKYCQTFRAQRAAILAVDPKAKFAGPAVSNPNDFLNAFVKDCGDVVDLLTWHVYPESGEKTDEEALASVTAVSDTAARYRALVSDPAGNPKGYQRPIALGVTEYSLSWNTNRPRHLADQTAALWAAEATLRLAESGAVAASYFALQATGGHGLLDISGTPRPSDYAFRLLAEHKGQPTAMSSSTPSLWTHAARDGSRLNVLVTNTSSDAVILDPTVKGFTLIGAKQFDAATAAAETDFKRLPARGVLTLAPRSMTRLAFDATRPDATVPSNAVTGPVLPQGALRNWSFRTDPTDAGLKGGWANGFTGGTAVQVPHQWAATDPSLFDYHGVAWYSTSFARPALKAGEHARVEFGGADYSARVWLNGHEIGQHVGYFQTFAFDLTPGLADENTLVVRVDEPLETGWQHNKRLIKGIFTHHDARPGDRTGRITGQSGSTGGLWGAVRLFTTGAATVSAPNTVTTLDGTTATLTATFPVVNGDGLPVRVTLSDANGQAVAQADATVTGGQAAAKLAVPNARLWSTWDRGGAYLYTLTAEVKASEAVSDAWTGRVGLRTLAMRDHTLILNGQPIYQRGTNYIPTEWLSRFGPADYARDLKLMREANLNAVRVHAHVLPDAFYTAADEAGILVWADFPLIWGYVDDAAMTSEALRQARGLLAADQHHASIWVWGWHNEPPWHATWIGLPGRNEALDNALADQGRKLDPTRLSVRASGEWDNHPYFGWYDGQYTAFSRDRSPFVTEYGAEAVPLSLLDYIPKAKLWPPSGLSAQWNRDNSNQPVGLDPAQDRINNPWAYHDVQLDLLDKYVGPWSDFDNPTQWALATQKYQAKLLQAVTEHYRRLKYAPTGGAYQFMFVDCWPAGTWSVLDVDRAPKLGYAALRDANQPTLASLAWPNELALVGRAYKSDLWVTQDRLDPAVPATLAWTVRVANASAVLYSGKVQLTVKPDMNEKVGTLSFTPTKDQPLVIELRLTTGAGTVLSANRYEIN
ncbi:MAG TPA: glycoside hydrolase family 2 TIM barrel-domain containing protein [Deinococcales bacterium]|nr:glycoside hydrolase family 2 TIM barrel-domain containing protein [Deinococcales bacterium]